MKTLAHFLCALSVVGLVNGPAMADSCHAVRTAGTYAGAPYVAPAYTGHYEVTPYALPVYIYPTQLYSVEPSIAYAAIVQAASDAAAAKTRLSPADLEFAVKKAVAEMFQAQRPPAAPPKDDPGLGPPVQAIPPAGQGRSALGDVKKIVAAKCVACHRAGDQYPDLTDLEKARAAYRKDKGQDLYSVMVLRVMTDGKGRMPPKGPSVAENGEELGAFHGLALEASLSTK